MAFVFSFKEGPQSGTGVLLENLLENGEGTFKIGRAKGTGPEKRLRIRDPHISSEHVEVTFADGKLTLEDLGSSNGTIVNGTKISEATELHVGDYVMMGRTGFVIQTVEEYKQSLHETDDDDPSRTEIDEPEGKNEGGNFLQSPSKYPKTWISIGVLTVAVAVGVFFLKKGRG